MAEAYLPVRDDLQAVENGAAKKQGRPAMSAVLHPLGAGAKRKLDGGDLTAEYCEAGAAAACPMARSLGTMSHDLA